MAMDDEESKPSAAAAKGAGEGSLRHNAFAQPCLSAVREENISTSLTAMTTPQTETRTRMTVAQVASALMSNRFTVEKLIDLVPEEQLRKAIACLSPSRQRKFFAQVDALTARTKASVALDGKFSARQNRDAIQRKNNALAIDESRLDLYSYESDEYPEYKISRQLKPYQKTRRISLDIETTGLNSESDRIISLGIQDWNGTFHIFSDCGEAILLTRAFQDLAKLSPEIAYGYNLYKFDLPFIAKRAALHDIPCPFRLLASSKRVPKSRTENWNRAIEVNEVEWSGVEIVDVWIEVLAWDKVQMKLTDRSLKTAALAMGLRDEVRLELSHEKILANWEAGNIEVIEELHRHFYRREDGGERTLPQARSLEIRAHLRHRIRARLLGVA